MEVIEPNRSLIFLRAYTDIRKEKNLIFYSLTMKVRIWNQCTKTYWTLQEVSNSKLFQAYFSKLSSLKKRAFISAHIGQHIHQYQHTCEGPISAYQYIGQELGSSYIDKMYELLITTFHPIKKFFEWAVHWWIFHPQYICPWTSVFLYLCHLLLFVSCLFAAAELKNHLMPQMCQIIVCE